MVRACQSQKEKLPVDFRPGLSFSCKHCFVISTLLAFLMHHQLLFLHADYPSKLQLHTGNDELDGPIR